MPAYAANGNCPTDNLQTAINNAPAGASLTVSGTCTGNFLILRSLTLVGPATLDGNNSGTVVNVPNPSTTVKLSYLTIQHGSAAGAAGIFNSGNLTLVGCTVTNNTASANVTISISSSPTCGDGCSLSDVQRVAALVGGGILNDHGTLTLNGSTVSNNTASGTGNVSESISQTCGNNCTLSQEEVQIGNAGGGIANLGGIVNLNSSTVSGNTATGNGTDSMSNSANCLANCAITVKDTDIGDAGGGIFSHGGSLSLSSSTVSGNSTSATRNLNITVSGNCTTNCSNNASITVETGGGGIFSDGPLDVSSSKITGNTSNRGGGGVMNGFGGTGSVKSSTISNNTAADLGGGVENFASLALKSDAITNNTASDGGGVYNGGSLTQSSNTYSGNSPNNCIGC